MEIKGRGVQTREKNGKSLKGKLGSSLMPRRTNISCDKYLTSSLRNMKTKTPFFYLTHLISLARQLVSSLPVKYNFTWLGLFVSC